MTLIENANMLAYGESLEGESCKVIDFTSEFTRLFPDLPPLITDYIKVILPTLIKNIEAESMRLAVTGSVYRRVIEGLDREGILFNGTERIKAVQQRFRKLSNATEGDLGECFPLVLGLARGPNDLDLKVGLSKGTITDSKEAAFGRIFLATAREVMIRSGGSPSDTIEKNKRRYINCPFNEQEVECSFGQISTNNKRKNAQLRFFQEGREIFRVDIGFYPGDFMGLLTDRRAGGQSVSRKQQGAIPLEIIKNDLSLVVKDPEAKVGQLADPDDFYDRRTPEITYPIEGEVEKLFRTIRVNLFHHRRLDPEDDICRVLFNQRIWDWMKEAVKEAIMAFSMEKPSLVAQQLFQKEMAVCLEEDPYLTLLVAEKIGLLKMFPAFAGTPIYLPRFLLTSDNLTFEVGENGGFLPLVQRNQAAILRQRELFLESGISGLRIVHDALFGGEKRGNMGERVTSEEFVRLMKCFDFGQSEVEIHPQLQSVYQREIYGRLYQTLLKEINTWKGRKYMKKEYLLGLNYILQQLMGFSFSRIACHFSYDDFEQYILNQKRPWFVWNDEDYKAKTHMAFNHLIRAGCITAVDKSFFILTPPNILETILNEE